MTTKPSTTVIDEIPSSLEPLSWNQLVEYKTRGFVGRNALSEKVDTWAKNPSSSTLLIEGEPGVGKSSFLAHYSTVLSSKSILAGLHFCRYDESKTLNARVFLASIGAQIIQWYKDRLVEDLKNSSSHPAPSESSESSITLIFNQTLSEISEILLNDSEGAIEGWSKFMAVLSKLPNPKKDVIGLVLLDSLDEAEDAGGRSIVSIVTSWAGGNHPSWLRMIVTSRPRIGIGSDRWTVIDLKADSTENLDDQRQWLLSRDDISSRDEVEALLKTSGGNWLYLTLVLAEGMGDSGELPFGLAGLYSRRLETQWKTPEVLSRLFRVLDVVVAAVGWVHVSVISAAASVDETETKAVLKGLGSMMARGGQDGSLVRVYHKSFTDWAVMIGIGGFLANEEGGHLALARVGLKVWNSQGSSPPVASQLAEYAVRWTVYHCVQTGEDSFKASVLESMGQKWDWIRVKAELDGWAAVSEEVTQLGGAGRRIGKLIKQWMHQGTLGVADGLSRHGGESLSGQLVGETNVRALNIGKPWDGSVDLSLVGAHDPIIAVGELPGGIALTGCYTKSLMSWDTRTGKREAVLSEITSQVHCIAVFPDGDEVAFGCYDRVIRIWSRSARKVNAVLSGHASWINGIAIVGSDRLVSVSDDSTVGFWRRNHKYATGWELVAKKSEVMEKPFLCVIPLPTKDDGVLRVATGSRKGTILIWNVVSCEAEGELSGHMAWVDDLAVLPDQRLVSGSWDATVRVWSSAWRGAEILTLRGHSDAVTSVAILPGSESVASGSWDTTVRIWSVAGEGSCIGLMSMHRAKINALITLSDGRLLSGSNDGTAIVWDADSAPSAAAISEEELERHTWDTALACAELKDGSVSVGFWGSHIAVWSPPGPGSEPVVTASIDQHLGAAAVLAVVNGQELLVANRQSNVLWSSSKKIPPPMVLFCKNVHGHWVKKFSYSWRNGTSRSEPVSAIAAMPDGERLISGGFDGTVHVWSGITGKLMKKLRPLYAEEHSQNQNDPEVLSFAVIGKALIAVGNMAGQIVLRDVVKDLIVANVGAGQSHWVHKLIPVDPEDQENVSLISWSLNDQRILLWSSFVEASVPEVIWEEGRGIWIPGGVVDGRWILGHFRNSRAVGVLKMDGAGGGGRRRKVVAVVNVEEPIVEVLWNEGEDRVTVLLLKGHWVTYEGLLGFLHRQSSERE